MESVGCGVSSLIVQYVIMSAQSDAYWNPLFVTFTSERITSERISPLASLLGGLEVASEDNMKVNPALELRVIER